MKEDILRIIEKTREYRERASRYLLNFEWEMEKGDREKAGEALWGVVSCLINALYLLKNGEPPTKHRVSGEFARQFIISRLGEKDGKGLVDVYGKVEKFHANFYHAFLDEEEFNNTAGNILKLVKCLDQILNDMLNETEAEIKASNG